MIPLTPRNSVCFFLLIAVCICVPGVDLKAQAVPVTLQKDGDSWQLLRDGKPYYIKGAGGQGSLQALKEAGGNSTRTWGVDDVDESMARLDEAHELGISVAFGIWLEHERHNKIDYDEKDSPAMKKQVDLTLDHVRRFKDHPAILVWGIGNEMEDDGNNPNIWKHIEDIARQVKEIDPHHPVMTVLAEIGAEGQKVANLHKFCPSVDIVGINSYAGVNSLPQRYRAAGGTKPFIVTEHGPAGPWEVGQDNIGAVPEMPSTEKGLVYMGTLDALKSESELCLGAYSFLWGHKQEATATWFGLFLKDGSKTSGVDILTKAWSGEMPENRCPILEDLMLDGQNEVDANAEMSAGFTTSDEEGDPLTVSWVLMAEAASMSTGGDFQKTPKTFPELIKTPSPAESTGTGLPNTTVNFLAPSEPGIYRIYAYVRDGQGGAATANLPFRVKSAQDKSVQGTEIELPAIVYSEPKDSTSWAPSGWMGSTDSISMDEHCHDNPHAGKHCLKFGFSNRSDWGGVVWQNPPDDWGEQPGGYDLTGATKLTFWARGAEGGEKMKFGFGLLGRDKTHYDTGKNETENITLTTDWKEYSLDLKDLNLSQIKTGFYWTLAGQGKPLTFYLDDIVFEKGD